MNKWIGIGRLVRDVETSTTASGVQVSKLTLAVDRKFKNEKGEKQADFVNVVCWRKLAELASQYLYKGSQCCIQGELQIRTYDNAEGKKVYVTEIIATDIDFLSTRNETTATPTKKAKVSELEEVPYGGEMPF